MQAPVSADRNAQPLLDISAIFSILWRRRLVIGASFVAMLVLAVFYLAVTRPVYTAQAVILVDPRETNATPSANVLGGIGTDSAAIASQVAVISSSALLRAVFDAENIATDPEFNKSGMLSSLFSLVRGSRGPVNESAVFEGFRSRVGVEREGLTYVLNITFTSEDPAKAARIANAIVTRYINGQVAEKSGASTEITGLLNDRITALRDDVTKAEQAVETFRTQNNIFDVGTGRTLLDTQIEQTSAQLIAAQEEARQANNRYQQARAVGTSPEGLARLTETLASGSAEQLRNSYNLRLGELARAEAELGARHPTLVSLRAEVSHLAGLMRNEAERIIAGLGAERNLAAANVANIEKDLVALRAQAADTSQTSVQLRQLERNADASRQVLEQYLARSEETSQLGGLQLADARVISAATPPVKATWPRPSLLLSVAGAFGLILGSGIALFLDAPARVASGGNRLAAPANTNAPPLLATPGAAGITDHGQIETRFQMPGRGQISKHYLDRTRREVTEHPRAPFALKVRSLSHRLLGNVPAGKTPAVFVFSSVDDRFEKARLTHSMALEMHRQGLNPLLLDLDPLVPNDAPELDLFMSGRGNPDPQSLTDAETGIAVITARARGASETQLANRVLEKLGHGFDAILVISKAVTDTDSLMRSGIADRHVLVLSATENRDAALSALAQTLPGSEVDLVTIAHGAETLKTPVAFPQRETADAVTQLRNSIRYTRLD